MNFSCINITHVHVSNLTASVIMLTLHKGRGISEVLPTSVYLSDKNPYSSTRNHRKFKYGMEVATKM